MTILGQIVSSYCQVPATIIPTRSLKPRYNIDPFDKHADEEVWRALERANLKKKVIGIRMMKIMETKKIAECQ